MLRRLVVFTKVCEQLGASNYESTKGRCAGASTLDFVESFNLLTEATCSVEDVAPVDGSQVSHDSRCLY